MVYVWVVIVHVFTDGEVMRVNQLFVLQIVRTEVAAIWYLHLRSRIFWIKLLRHSSQVSLQEVFPTAGTILGGTRVYLGGINFVDSKEIFVRFGNLIVTGQFQSMLYNRHRTLEPFWVFLWFQFN